MSLTKNLGRVRLVWQGEYDEETQYTYLDAVSYEGSSYMCFTETPPPVGTLPTDEDYFLVLAEKGAPSDATENSYLWLKESGSVVQCYPVPESELDLKVYFALVETLPEEGEKGPENPSTISGWNEIEVTRCGKNLAPPYQPYNGAGVTGTVDHIGRITIDGEATGTVRWRSPQLPKGFNDYQRDYTYSINSSNTANGGRTYLYYYPSGGTSHNLSFSHEEVYKTGLIHLSETDEVSQTIAASPGDSFNNFILTSQLELGSIATTYEPYIGDTYTIELPDTFYGGYVDFERGVLVQTHQKITFDGTENWGRHSVSDVFLCVPPIRLGGYFPINNFFTQGENPSDTTEVCVAANGGNAVTGWSSIAVHNAGEQLGYTTSDEWKTYLAQLATAGNPLKVVYELFTPIEHPLEDLVPIKALTQTDRYTPQLNTVYANTNGDIELGYAKSPIKEHLDLINAITATGGANV